MPESKPQYEKVSRVDDGDVEKGKEATDDAAEVKKCKPGGTTIGIILGILFIPFVPVGGILWFLAL